MKEMITRYTKIEKFFPYRKARMVYAQIFLTLSRDTEEMKQLEDILSEKAGVNKDNHVIYELKNRDGYSLFIQFTDSEVNFGSGITIN